MEFSRCFRYLFCALFTLIGLAQTTHAKDPLELSLSNVFVGSPGKTRSLPLWAEIDNNGPDARGILQIGDSVYPVELPQGSTKRLMVYATPSFEKVRVTLQTNRGTIFELMDVPAIDSPETRHVLLIGDNPGELSFIPNEDRRKNRASLWRPLYVLPDDAPRRVRAYEGIHCIFLGDGSERLSDETVAALKLWTLNGGTLVFVGGASTPILRDPRWTALLPVGDFRLKMNADLGLKNANGTPYGQSLTITDATPLRNAKIVKGSGGLIGASIGRGLGSAVYFSFNPFEKPLNQSGTRWQTMSTLVTSASPGEAHNFLLSAQSGAWDQLDDTPWGGTGMQNDPFQTKLPSATKVFWILIGYFIAVVPLNFGILRKFKKGELAWFTAPALSLIFAGLFFLLARNLYAADTATATQGVLVVDSSVPDGMFFGRTQMFFARGGSYDLKLKNTDVFANWINERSGYDPFASRHKSDWTAVDLGHVEIPAYNTTNLSFEDVGYTQVVPNVSSWLTVQVVENKGDRFVLKIQNRSLNKIADARALIASSTVALNDLAPGSTKIQTVWMPNKQKIQEFMAEKDNLRGLMPSYSYVDVEYGDTNEQLQFFLCKTGGRIAVIGDIEGVRFGPQVGQEVAGRRATKIVAFANIQEAP